MISQNYQQLGFSLLELVISLTLLSIILLGFDAVQITMLNYAKNNYFYTLADQQLDSIVERLQAQQGDYDLAAWNLHNKSVLPNANAWLEDGQVKISWMNTQGKQVYAAMQYE